MPGRKPWRPSATWRGPGSAGRTWPAGSRRPPRGGLATSRPCRRGELRKTGALWTRIAHDHCCRPNGPRCRACWPARSGPGRETEDEEGGGDSVDPATSLTAEGMDDAITDSMRDRLAAIDRALKRLDDGSYGRSVRSGVPIPDERLEADPAAELTVEEARQAERDAEHEQARDVGQ